MYLRCYKLACKPHERGLSGTRKLIAPFMVRDADPKDRPQWEPLWQAYQTFRKASDEVTDATWKRFFDESEPVHALVAAEGETLIGFVHYLYHCSTAQLDPICYLQMR
jgi:hypothetical protein